MSAELRETLRIREEEGDDSGAGFFVREGVDRGTIREPRKFFRYVQFFEIMAWRTEGTETEQYSAESTEKGTAERTQVRADAELGWQQGMKPMQTAQIW